MITRRDLFRQLGLIGAAIIVAPQVFAENTEGFTSMEVGNEQIFSTIYSKNVIRNIKDDEALIEIWNLNKSKLFTSFITKNYNTEHKMGENPICIPARITSKLLIEYSENSYKDLFELINSRQNLHLVMIHKEFIVECDVLMYELDTFINEEKFVKFIMNGRPATITTKSE